MSDDDDKKIKPQDLQKGGRFSKGQSGNPKGRPKKAKSVEDSALYFGELPSDKQLRQSLAKQVTAKTADGPKAFAKKFRGVGSSSTWRLNVEYLTRSGEEMPREGVPFTAVLTISDPKAEMPVFNDMRQNLMALGTTIADIRTAARIASRT